MKTIAEFAAKLFELHVPDPVIHSLCAALQRENNVEQKGLTAIYKHILKAQTPFGEPVGGNYAHSLMSIMTQRTLNSFYADANVARDEGMRSGLAKLMDSSFASHELFVRLHIPGADEEKLKNLGSALYRPLLGKFILKSTFTEAVSQCLVPGINRDTQKSQEFEYVVFEITLDPMMMYKYRLTPFCILQSLYALDTVRQATWQCDTDIMKIVVTLAITPDPMLTEWQYDAVVLERIDALANNAIHNTKLCLLQQATDLIINVKEQTITIFGPVFQDIIAMPLLDDSIKMSLITNDIKEYQKVFGLLATKQLLIFLYCEIMGDNMEATASFLVNCMFHTGTFVKNNVTNIFEASGSFVDSISDRNVDARVKAHVFGGVVSNTDTNSARIITGGVPHLGTRMSQLQLVPNTDNTENRRMCWIFIQALKAIPVALTSSVAHIGLQSMFHTPRRSQRVISGRGQSYVILNLDIHVPCYGYTLRIDARSPTDEPLECIHIDNFRVRPFKRDRVVLTLNNIQSHDVAIDLTKSTLSIVAPVTNIKWHINREDKTLHG